MYSCFLTCIARSGNAILQSIKSSDALYTSPVLPLAENAFMYIVISDTLFYLFYMDVMFRNKVIELKKIE